MQRSYEEVSDILEAIRARDDREAEELFTVVRDELRNIARFGSSLLVQGV